MKYYFVTYQELFSDGTQRLNNDLIDIHPLEFSVELYRKSTYGQTYMLVWWNEISKEEYEKYK